MGWSSRAGGAEANSLADHTGIANDDKAGRADVHLVATLVLYKKRKRAISPHQVVYYADWSAGSIIEPDEEVIS